MTPDPTPAQFYDDLAADYHLIFADWDAAIAWEADIIAALLRDRGVTAGPVLDASCGIGTQAIGLARAGFAVTATDISPASVERCAREAAARGLTLTTAVADLRTLDVAGGGSFAAAGGALRRALRPSGLLLASIRDYDAALRERPSGDPPRRYPTEDGERIVFQGGTGCPRIATPSVTS